MRFTTIIADNDVSSRVEMRSLISNYPEFDVVGECEDGDDAIRMVKALRPQLLFMDVHIPKMDGISVLRALPPESVPLTVFVTSDPAHAVDAFEVHAADYVLKPFDKVRFIKALEWAKIRLGQDHAADHDRTRRQPEEVDETASLGQMNRIMIKSNGRVNLLRVSDIDWIEASGNYLRLHVGDKVHMIRETMSNMEKRLNSDQFMRIHRSTIVNIDRIKEMQPWFHGEYEVHLHNGKRLSMSRGYKDKLNGLLKK